MRDEGGGDGVTSGSPAQARAPKPAILAVDDDPQVLAAVARDLRRQYGERFRILRAADGRTNLQPRVAPYAVFEERPDHGRILDDHDPDLPHISCLIVSSSSV